jgi:hypothetical protein
MEKSLIEIFLTQLLAAALGALSTALADWLYNAGRIGQRLHIFWLSSSIAAICLPVLGWVSSIFVGSGAIGRGIAGLLVGAIFWWVYRNLPKTPVGAEARSVRAHAARAEQHSP